MKKGYKYFKKVKSNEVILKPFSEMLNNIAQQLFI